MSFVTIRGRTSAAVHLALLAEEQAFRTCRPAPFWSLLLPVGTRR